jgi:hypothetical protein
MKDIKPIEKITISNTGVSGKIAGMRAALKEQAEERNVKAAANAMFSLTDEASFMRLAMTFDQLEHVSTVVNLRADVRRLEKQVEKLTGSNNKLDSNLKGASKRASRVAELERQLADQEAGFKAVLSMFGIDPNEVETMLAEMEAELINEEAAVSEINRSNRLQRSNINTIRRVAKKA